MIVPQKSAQPIAASHWLVVVRFVDPMEQQQVVLTLVISLCMIVSNIVVHAQKSVGAHTIDRWWPM
jgi:hypothetical protein